MSEHAEQADHGPQHYLKIWAILLVLLAISVAGPTLGIAWVTLVTAFGIACVKAFMVAKYFMHITAEAKFITYMVSTTLVFMLLFFAAVAPDVMKFEGSNWVKVDHSTQLIPVAHHGQEQEHGGGHGEGQGEESGGH